jgi:predicted NBD/HSP70 family sugar kinase
MRDHIAPLGRIPYAFRRRDDAVAVSANERRLLEIIRRAGVTSRAELTRATELAPQSISRLIEGLEARGLVTLGERQAGNGPGQPSLAVRLAPKAAISVGVSIMTDRVAMATMGLDGAILAEKALQPADMSIAAVIQDIEAAIASTFADHALDRSRLFGIGVGMSGFFTGEGVRMNPPDPLAHWAVADLDARWMDASGLPVWIENDGNAAAIGESLFGVGLTHPSFAYLYFTYGLGGGVVIDGKLVRGVVGNAGEFSAILPPERHDRRPTMESLRRAIVAAGVEVADIGDLAQRFDPSWPGVETWIERVREPLCDIISAISGVLDTGAIVFGGQIPKALAHTLATRVEFYNRARRGEYRPTPRLLVSPLEGNATAIGAASMPLKYGFFQ